ncbi:MAG: STAS domain-containing protein [Bryobacteraceae bacterium]
MRLESQVRENVCVMRLKGRFVTGSEDELRLAQRQLRDTKVDRAIIDLSEVPYIDSTGLAFVVELHKSLESRGGQLALANANPRVRQVLALTRIGEVIPVYEDESAARHALSGSQLVAGGAGR